MGGDFLIYFNLVSLITGGDLLILGLIVLRASSGRLLTGIVFSSLLIILTFSGGVYSGS